MFDEVCTTIAGFTTIIGIILDASAIRKMIAIHTGTYNTIPVSRALSVRPVFNGFGTCLTM